jgi:hypothetical protein
MNPDKHCRRNVILWIEVRHPFIQIHTLVLIKYGSLLKIRSQFSLFQTKKQKNPYHKILKTFIPGYLASKTCPPIELVDYPILNKFWSEWTWSRWMHWHFWTIIKLLDEAIGRKIYRLGIKRYQILNNYNVWWLQEEKNPIWKQRPRESWLPSISK